MPTMRRSAGIRRLRYARERDAACPVGRYDQGRHGAHRRRRQLVEARFVLVGPDARHGEPFAADGACARCLARRRSARDSVRDGGAARRRVERLAAPRERGRRRFVDAGRPSRRAGHPAPRAVPRNDRHGRSDRARRVLHVGRQRISLARDAAAPAPSPDTADTAPVATTPAPPSFIEITAPGRAGDERARRSRSPPRPSVSRRAPAPAAAATPADAGSSSATQDPGVTAAKPESAPAEDTAAAEPRPAFALTLACSARLEATSTSRYGLREVGTRLPREWRSSRSRSRMS